MTKRSDKVLYYGDNLDVMRLHGKDESVDLIYLDPPFNSKATYNVLFKTKDGNDSPAAIKAFDDSWHWDLASRAQYEEVVEQGGEVADTLRAFRTLLGDNDMLAYLTMMAPRLIEMRRILKKTGSIYLHCDPTASHYLKILLDAVFGRKNFRNEIVWKRTSAAGSAKRCGPIHDIIFYYTKSDTRTWNQQFQPYDPEYVDDFFEMQDVDGRRWKRGDLTGAGVRTGDSGKPWRSIDVTAKGRHWALPSYLTEKYRQITGKELESYAAAERLDKIDAAGLIHWPKKKGGVPRYKCYLEDMPGVPLQDVWTDIGPIHNLSPERLGYPTQKPRALLERIVQASSNDGDLVMDPFCGCGTTIEAAEKHNRRWIGIDITHLAVGLIKKRLLDAFGNDIDLIVEGEPTVLGAAIELADQDKYQFQWWVLGMVGARPAEDDQKKGADGGIDGRLYFHDDGKKTKQILISVKGGQKVGLKDLKELAWTVQSNDAQIGVLISLASPTKPMRIEATKLGFYETIWGKFPRLQLLTVEDLFAGKRIEYPGRGQHDVTHRKAPKVKKTKKQEKLDV